MVMDHRQTSVRSPTRLAEITPAGWWRIGLGVWRGVRRDHLLTLARAIAFSAVMALLPTLAAFVSLYGLVADATRARDHLSLLAGLMPENSLALLGDEMVRIAGQTDASLSLTLGVGLVMAFLTANTGMRVIVRALDIAYEEPERRRSWRVSIAASGLTLTAFALLLLTTAGLLAIPLALQVAPGLQHLSPLRVLRWPLLFGLAVLTCELLYRFGPTHPLARWRWISAGSGLTAGLWIAGSVGLTWYVGAFEGFAATYGSLGAIFAVLIWVWLTAIFVVLGAKMNAEIEREIVRPAAGRPDRGAGRGKRKRGRDG